MKEKRRKWDRREEEQRCKERRVAERRNAMRRGGNRRKDFCPSCGRVLTPAYYCSTCKVRVIKIRNLQKSRAAKR